MGSGEAVQRRGVAVPEFGITQLESPLGKVVDPQTPTGQGQGSLVAEGCSLPVSQGRAIL